MAELKIEYEGQVYEFDELDLDVDEAETIQKYVGRNLGDWTNGLSTCEVKSLVALWWVLRKRAGQNPGSIAAKVPGFRPVKLFYAFAEAYKAAADVQSEQEQEQAEPDPTNPSAVPSSPAPAGTATTPAAAPPALFPTG